jgi:hypothetical protein
MFFCGEIAHFGDIFQQNANKNKKIVILRDSFHPFLKKN